MLNSFPFAVSSTNFYSLSEFGSCFILNVASAGILSGRNRTSDSEADKTPLHPLNSSGSQMAFSHCESTHLQLSLLSKLSERGDGIGGQIFSDLPQESLKLIRECRYLEEKLSCQGCTDTLLSSQSSRREMKREILQTDWDVCITEAKNYSSTTIAARIATNVSWLNL